MPEHQREPQALFDVLKVKTKVFEEMNSMGHDKGNRDAAKPKKDGKRKQSGGDRKHDAKKAKTDHKNVKCLKCGQQGHFMAKCPQKPNKEEQELLLKKHRAQASMKKPSDNKSPKLTYVLRVESSQCNDTNSIDVIVANDQLVFKGILDSGAEATIVPMTIAQRILEIDSNATLSRLDSEVKVELPNGSNDMITYEVILDLVLRSKAGKLTVPSQRCLVRDINSDAILLGDDLLKAIGIDPKSALNSMIARTPVERELIMETDEDCSPVIGISSDDEIDKALRKMVNDAVNDGMPGHMKDPVLKLVMKHKNVWRRSLGPDPPAKVTPLVTKLKAGAEPVRCKARRYSKEQSEYLHEITCQLKEHGLIYENYNCEWASPVLVVKKPVGYRMTVDLRAVNALCEATIWPMPHLESIVRHLSSSKYWFSLDAFKGFWIMPLAEECQEMFSFMTDRAVFTPTRSIQGALNSAAQFQARMHEIFSGLQRNLVIWIDDVLGHAQTESEWFRILEQTLKLADERNLKLNVDKCKLFQKQAKFCGRIFSPNGVSHDPERIQALSSMKEPTRASELQQFLMAAQWMSRSIPNFNKIVVPLQDMLEQAMKGQPKRTKAVARGVRLNRHGWNVNHRLAFERLKLAIASIVELAYPREDMIQCVFSDASQLCSSGMVTQIPVEDECKPIHEQRHQPLGFVGHRFNGSELNWATVDKEAFAIRDTLKKLDYLLQCYRRPFKLFTDHRNLIAMYNPTRCTKQSAERLIRWGIELRDFNFTIHHISGEDNVWADLLSRWGAVDDEIQLNVAVKRVSTETPDSSVDQDSSTAVESLIENARVQPLSREKFVWPDMNEIADEQRRFLSDQKDLICKEDGLLVDDNNRVVIPTQSQALKMRLCIIAHAGCNSGHIGLNAAFSLLADRFYWATMRKDLQRICKSCLHCLPTRSGFRKPRPLGEACHGTEKGQVIHFDYLYVYPRKENAYHTFEWLFVIRDDYSGMVMLTPVEKPNTITTVDALMQWRSWFGRTEVFVSDQASYFMSEVMREFAKRCNTQQHWTTAYAHYPNGSIEVINKHFLSLMRALISELRWNKEDWPWLVKLVEHTLNHRPQARLGGLAPYTVWTGKKADNPLDLVFYDPSNVIVDMKRIPESRIRKYAEALQLSMDQMHKVIDEATERERQSHRKHSSARSRPNFGIGDFVLVGVPEKRTGQKLSLNWRGPYRVVSLLNGYVFDVENIITNEKRQVHGDRLQFYADNKLNITEDIKTQFAFDNETFEIEKVIDMRMHNESGELQLLIQWKGFTEDENSWEPATSIYADAPALVKLFHARNRTHIHAKALSDIISRTKASTRK